MTKFIICIQLYSKSKRWRYVLQKYRYYMQIISPSRAYTIGNYLRYIIFCSMLVPSANYVAVTATISKYLQYDDALKQRFETQINHFLISVSALCPTTKLLTYRCLLEPMVVHHISNFLSARHYRLLCYKQWCLKLFDTEQLHDITPIYLIEVQVQNLLLPLPYYIHNQYSMSLPFYCLWYFDINTSFFYLIFRHIEILMYVPA